MVLAHLLPLRWASKARNKKRKPKPCHAHHKIVTARPLCASAKGPHHHPERQQCVTAAPQFQPHRSVSWHRQTPSCLHCSCEASPHLREQPAAHSRRHRSESHPLRHQPLREFDLTRSQETPLLAVLYLPADHCKAAVCLLRTVVVPLQSLSLHCVHRRGRQGNHLSCLVKQLLADPNARSPKRQACHRPKRHSRRHT